MPGIRKFKQNSQALRHRAEELLIRKVETTSEIPGEDVRKMVHELEVHQIELEMQAEELRQQQRELQQSRDKYRDLYDSSPVGYFMLDRDSVILEVNLTGSLLLGIPRSKLLKKKFHNYVLPGFQDTFYFHMERVFEAREKQVCELEILKKDGSQFYVQLQSQASADSEGNRNRCRMAIIDITKRKKAEEALRGSEEKYRLLFDNMFNGCALCRIIKDTDGEPADFIYVEINRAFEKLTGLSSEAVLGKKVTRVFPSIKEQNPEIIPLYGKVALTGEPAAFEVFFKPLGIWLAISVYSPFHDYFVAVFDNITERKIAEEQLKQRELQLQKLFEVMAEAVILVSPESKIVRVNKEAEKILGLPQSELVGHLYSGPNFKMNPKWKVLRPDGTAMKSRERPGLRAITEKRVIKDMEVGIKKPDGSITWLNASVTPIVNADGTPGGLVTTFNDITEQRRLKKEIEYYAAKVTRLQEQERKRIAFGLHEDILQSIAALIYKIENYEKKQISEDTKVLLRDLQNSARPILKDLQQLTNELRPGVLEFLGLEESLDTLAEELNETGPTKYQLKTSGARIPLSEEVNLALFRIAQEALTNTQKYSQAKNAHISLKYAPHKVRLTIADDGLGFDLEKTNKSVMKQDKLGLIGIKERARHIGGTADIKSQPGKGTTIFIELNL